MTWTTPVDQTTGHLVTASEFNTQVIDNLKHLYAQGIRDFAITSVAPGVSVTPDLNGGTYQAVTITAGATNTTTINATTNVPGANQTALLYVYISNTSANSQNLSWNAQYIAGAGGAPTLPGSVAAGVSTAVLFIWNPSVVRWFTVLKQ